MNGNWGLNFKREFLKAVEVKNKEYNSYKQLYVQSVLLGLNDENKKKIEEAISRFYDIAYKNLLDFTSKINNELKSGKAFVFRMEQIDEKKGIYDLIRYDNRNKYGIVRRLFRSEMYDHVFKTYLSKVSNKARNYGFSDKRALIVAGEMAMLQECGRRFEDVYEIFKRLNSIHLLAGPFVVVDEDDNMNNFIRFLSDRFDNATYSRNALLPFESLYSGYFHCYVIDDVVLLELPHEFMHKRSKINHIAIFQNTEIAKWLHRYFEEYEKFFAEKYNNKKSLSDFFQYSDLRLGTLKLDDVANVILKNYETDNRNH